MCIPPYGGCTCTFHTVDDRSTDRHRDGFLMPTRPRSPCSAPRCPNLKPCPVHGRQAEQAYDTRRGSAASRGYDARHRRWRLLVLAEHPLCVDPDRRHPGVVRASVVADHIVPLREWERDEVAAGAALAVILTQRRAVFALAELGPWSLLNGQGLDLECHAVKSGREAHGGGAVKTPGPTA